MAKNCPKHTDFSGSRSSIFNLTWKLRSAHRAQGKQFALYFLKLPVLVVHFRMRITYKQFHLYGLLHSFILEFLGSLEYNSHHPY